MSNKNNKNRLSLDLISNGIAESLLNASDKEIQEEAKDVFGSVNAGVNAFDRILEKAEIAARKNKLAAIRITLNQKELSKRGKASVVSIAEARNRIEQALEHARDSEVVTLAARYGEGMPDEDVLDLYEDLVDLELISTDEHSS